METSTPAIPLTMPYMGFGYGGFGGYGNYGGNYGGGYNNNNSCDCVQEQISQLHNSVTSADTRSAIGDVGNKVVNGTASVKESVAGVNQNVTNGNYTTLTGLNDLGRDINHTINRETIAWMDSIHKSDLQNMNSFNNTNREMDFKFNQTFLQGKDITADVARSSADIRTEMLAQHCDIKTLVKEENAKTRELINNNTMLDLQRQLNDVKSENSNFKQTRDLLSSLVECRPKAPCPCDPCASTSPGNSNR